MIEAIAVAALVGLLYAIRRHRRVEVERAAAAVAAMEQPSSDADQKSGARIVATPREQRAVALRDRERSGLCRYCEQRATHQVPRLRQVQSLLDPLYRWLGVVPVARWRIEVQAALDEGIPEVLCEMHAGSARSHVERYVAECSVDYAGFVERQRRELEEFAVYALDERMSDDAAAIRSRRRSKKSGAQVTPLRAVNGGQS